VLSTFGGPGGPGFRRTVQLAVAGLDTPALFRDATVTVNVAESHGTASSLGANVRAVVLPLAGSPPAAVEPKTAVHVPFVAATLIVKS
jgi:hypothetical protein